MMNFALDMYRQMFINLKRGNYRGVYSDAKPIFLISLIDYIPFMSDNKLVWEDKKFEEVYYGNFSKLSASKHTPICKPFYFMTSEKFYSIKWRKMPKAKDLISPSSKTLRDFSFFAKVDDDLWKLLQDANNRSYLRNCIINAYFAEKTK